ncbi:hypothetical protein EVG20_g11690 [Dentipellis fragilis]|uniref:Uncharacterized protein n=1 Tax=Dentipellis fragilis TaxID=205917 RepID=A0A4Y9XJR0_9AGAM|nr:hypothetical protein EVG20_g11690 [Dentipellis fragilis]
MHSAAATTNAAEIKLGLGMDPLIAMPILQPARTIISRTSWSRFSDCCTNILSTSPYTTAPPAKISAALAVSSGFPAVAGLSTLAAIPVPLTLEQQHITDIEGIAPIRSNIKTAGFTHAEDVAV